MMRPILPIVVLGAAVTLGGCADRTTRSMGFNQARCHAAGAQSVLGQTAEAQVVEQALAASGGLRARVIRPGEPVANDADPMRLNIQVDETGRIRRMVCG